MAWRPSLGFVLGGLTIDNENYRISREALPEYLRPLFVTAHHTGARLGELLKLTWDRVDFAGKQVFMSPQTTKAKKPRTLPIYGDMQDYLGWALHRRDANFPRCEWVFTRAGRRIADIRKAWARATTAAGVPGFLFHDLRRTAARNMRRAGIDELTVRRILGHETDSMFRRYGIITGRDVAEAGEKAAAFLAQRTAEEENKRAIAGGKRW